MTSDITTQVLDYATNERHWTRQDGTTPVSLGKNLSAKQRGMLRLVPLGVLALTVAACGTTQASSPPASSSPSASVVQATHNAKLGEILVDSKGNALYELVSPQGAPLPCTGSCNSIWPPLLLAKGLSSPKAGSGVSGQLGLAHGSANSRQISVGGIPLYTYSGDSGPGQVNGEGIRSFGGVWYAVGPDGAVVKGSSSSSSKSSSGGYGAY